MFPFAFCNYTSLAPARSRPSPSSSPSPITLRCAASSPLPRSANLTLPRRHLLQLFLSLSLPTPALSDQTASSPQSAPTPRVTDRVFFDLSVAGRPVGRVTVALFADHAPVSVQTFKQLAQGTLRNRSGRTVGYKYAQAARVVPGKRVELGRVKQIDALNQQPGVPQRQIVTVQVPENRDSNNLSHQHKGLVSVKRGGSFEFSVLLAPDPALDHTSIVIGSVVDGINVVDVLANVPTNRKTIRDGYRNIGKAIGDARAKVDLEDKPLQKIQITNCGLL